MSEEKKFKHTLGQDLIRTNMTGAQLIRNVKKLSNKTFFEAVERYFGMSKKELEECIKDPDLSMNDYMLIAIMQRIVKKGDYRAYSMLLDRTLGKVAQQVDVVQFLRENPDPIQQREAVTVDVKNLPTEALRILDSAFAKDVTPKPSDD